MLEPIDEASVARYQLEARAIVERLEARGVVPILVGGSGLYVSSVVYDYRFPGTDPVIRERLEAELAEQGPRHPAPPAPARSIPTAAEAIGPHNGRRLVRALEVIELTGGPFGAGLPSETGAVAPDRDDRAADRSRAARRPTRRPRAPDVARRSRRRGRARCFPAGSA